MPDLTDPNKIYRPEQPVQPAKVSQPIPEMFNKKNNKLSSPSKSRDSLDSIPNLSSIDSLSKLKSSPRKSPDFEKMRSSDSEGLRDRANILVSFFGGENLSEKKLSIVKGAMAYKFKCINGHIFYKFASELQDMTPLLIRKLSKSTMASSSSDSISSDDEKKNCLDSWQLEGHWCTKCESFYKHA